jgi:hypothetical protein
MSDNTIEKHHVVAFARNLSHPPQQKMAKLVDCVDSDMSFTDPGGYYTDEILGTSDPALITNRYGDSPTKALDRARRGGYFYAYEDGNFIDNVDKARQLVDPANGTVEAMQFGIRRGRDQFIWAAGLGAAREGQTLENSVAFPAGQKIAHGGTGLTIAKLRAASKLLDNGEVEGERFWAGGASDKDNLLATTEATSSDYNTVKALVNGEINTFLGFTFKWFADKRVPKDASGYRRNMAWVKPAIWYRSRPIIEGEKVWIGQRWDKKGAWYAYASFDQGAHRHLDEGVVEVTNQ